MSRVIRDPVYGTILLEEWEHELLQMPELQRLRHIKHTGLAFLAYPSAIHTIFDQTLGTLCLAKRYVHHLHINANEEKLLFASILISGIGSEPLRHVLWDVESRIPHEKRKMLQLDIEIVQSSKQIETVLRKARIEPNEIYKIIRPPRTKNGIIIEWSHRLQPLLHGPVSFNRLDYYLRDAYYAGIKTVGFDPEEILSRASLHEEKGIVFSKEAVPAIENFLLSRVNMYFNLYSNPEAIKGQKMLARVIEIFIDDNYEKFYDFRRKTVSEFLSDDEFIYKLQEKIRDDKIAQRILQLIGEGQLYKTLDNVYRWPELPNETQRKLESYYRNPIDWKEREERINSALGTTFGEIIIDIDKPTIESFVKNIYIKTDCKIERVDKVSPLIGPLEEEEKRRHGIMEMEKRNWFLGIYYDYEKVKEKGINESQIRKKTEEVFNITLSR